MAISPDLFAAAGGQFLSSPDAIRQKLAGVRAIIFDWDGVFNTGTKAMNNGTGFSEVDAMGINLFRFSRYLPNSEMPVTAIISGEDNPNSFLLARREKFNAAYFKVSNKIEALRHFCRAFVVIPSEILFVYDDVLDLSIAREVSLRINVRHQATVAFQEYIKANKHADYITGVEGGNHAIREAVEMLMCLDHSYEDVVQQRLEYSQRYQQYLTSKRLTILQHFTTDAATGMVAQVYPEGY